MDKVKQYIKEVIYAYQRVKYGYDERAINDTDEYLARIIPDILLNQVSMNYHCSDKLTKDEDMKLDIADGLHAYTTMRGGEYKINSKEFKLLKKKFNNAMNLLRDNFSELYLK